MARERKWAGEAINSTADEWVFKSTQGNYVDHAVHGRLRVVRREGEILYCARFNAEYVVEAKDCVVRPQLGHV